MTTRVMCILGNQLFDPQLLPLKSDQSSWIFMREDNELCTHFKYHKHKIIFFLSAMRKYAIELQNSGFKVHYEKLGEFKETYEERLIQFLCAHKCQNLEMFEIEDKFFEKRINEVLTASKINLKIYDSPMFLTSRQIFPKLISHSKKPFMKNFYENQRKRLKILIEKDGTPVGGKWSFDELNRKPLPKKHQCPSLPKYEPDKIDTEVFHLVDSHFGDHPGNSYDFWLPTDRKGAREWARNFFDNRFSEFGPYEDALSQEYPFIYHSVLTPFLNTGLITPGECVSAALQRSRKLNISLNSCEGYIRQIIGWREFVRGIYQNYSEEQESRNHFNHHKKLSPLWYLGQTGIPPLDDVIKKVKRFGYAHHIERLMVVGSLMVLLEVDPMEAYRWFMEMFIDSSDWVMGPNVYGMGIFSDGGIFATKPYICGSNYYRKMSGYKTGEWCEAVDGLYWSFIKKNKSMFDQNPRMSMIVHSLNKISPEKMARLELAANSIRNKLVVGKA